MMGQVLAEIIHTRDFILTAKYTSYFDSYEIKKFK